MTAWYKWRYGCSNVVVLSSKLHTLIACLHVMKYSWSATDTWVLEGLEETYLAQVGRGLHEIHYRYKIRKDRQHFFHGQQPNGSLFLSNCLT